MSAVSSKVLNFPAWPTPCPLSTAASHHFYFIFPNQPQNKLSQISYIFFPLPSPSPNTLSPAYLKHNLLSHWFLLCKLPTPYTSPAADTLLPHRKHLSISVHKTVTNLPIGITGAHQRNSGKSRACFQTNTWTRRYMNLPTYIIGMRAFFEHQPATQKTTTRQMSTLTAHDQTRQYQEKLITGLQAKQRNPSFEDGSGSLLYVIALI